MLYDSNIKDTERNGILSSIKKEEKSTESQKRQKLLICKRRIRLLQRSLYKT